MDILVFDWSFWVKVDIENLKNNNIIYIIALMKFTQINHIHI